MKYSPFLLCCIFFATANCSNVCTLFDKYNFINDQSNLNLINEALEPWKSILPVHDNITIPKYGELIEQFQKGKANADVYLNFTQLVTKYGYPVEQHEVVTEDEYILTVFRIPKPCAPVVILVHGLACSSDDWITGGLEVSLAYSLADAGYDVWLGNTRGNKHARKHRTLSPDCVEFWQFGYDEIGLYDLPATIDYILKHTGQYKLSYIGHSQGTTIFYVMASDKPEYNEKISIMVSLSAVVFTGHVRSPFIQLFAPLSNDLAVLGNLVGVGELFPRDELIDIVTSTFCGSPKIAEIICENLIFLGCGFDYAQLNVTNLPVIYGHYPAGASVRQIVQYGQSTISGNFAKYDHGPFENMIRYGTPKPPEYALEKVSCPIAIFYSNNDWLNSAPDIFKLLNKLPNVIEFYHVPCASYQHFDFLFAKDGGILVNSEVLVLLQKYAENSRDNDDIC
ncbi:lipase 3-like [Plodia interpunctella]|uniref:lipase 3-like n=1 Tax=Plodia interpunctella TaxID=58824 RepID=UPI002368A400|nr:lipase 3-like [Plodia interpunctella]